MAMREAGPRVAAPKGAAHARWHASTAAEIPARMCVATCAGARALHAGERAQACKCVAARAWLWGAYVQTCARQRESMWRLARRLSGVQQNQEQVPTLP